MYTILHFSGAISKFTKYSNIRINKIPLKLNIQIITMVLIYVKIGEKKLRGGNVGIVYSVIDRAINNEQN